MKVQLRRKRADQKIATLKRELSQLKRAIESQSEGVVRGSKMSHSIEEAIERDRKILHALYDGLSEAFIKLDEHGCVSEWNQQAELDFGWTESEAMGQPLVEMLTLPKQRKNLSRKLGHLLELDANLATEEHLEIIVCRKDQLEFPVEMVLWSTRLENQTQVHVFIRNLSGKKRLARLKNEYISTASHELRTPITIIREGVNQILDGILGAIRPEQRALLEIAESAMARLTRMVNDLLDVSKLEAGKLTLRPRCSDVVGLMKEIGAHFEVRAKAKGVKLVLHASAPTIQTSFDYDKMNQVFNYLLSNALHNTWKGSIKVSIEDLGSDVQCSVVDTGKGYSEHDIRDAFKKFHRFRAAQSRQEEGAGLALAIVKGIIEKHHGQIHVKSEVGKGSTFLFTIPKRTPEQIFQDLIHEQAGRYGLQECGFTMIVLEVNDGAGLTKKLSVNHMHQLEDRLEGVLNGTLRRRGDCAIVDFPRLLVLLEKTDRQQGLLVAARLNEALDKSFRESDFPVKVCIKSCSEMGRLNEVGAS